MKIETPKHFSVLGCAPFWSLSLDDEKHLKAHFLSLTRKYHPDLLDLDCSDKTREEYESKSSELNSAYLKIKDPFERCDYILSEVERQNPENFSLKTKVELPLELSMNYFELQEALEDGSNSPAVRAELASFSEKLQAIANEESMKLAKALSRLQTKLDIQTSASESGSWPLKVDDLTHIAGIRGLQKYIDRILIDIRKFQ